MRILALASCLVLVCACGKMTDPRVLLPQVHRMELVQGNIITQQMVDQLKTGMTREQVRFVMGTPLVQDSFSSGIWRYYYRFQDDRRRAVVRRVTLRFQDEVLADISGDLVPNPAAEPGTGPDGQPDDNNPEGGKPVDSKPGGNKPENGKPEAGKPEGASTPSIQAPRPRFAFWRVACVSLWGRPPTADTAPDGRPAASGRRPPPAGRRAPECARGCPWRWAAL